MLSLFRAVRLDESCTSDATLVHRTRALALVPNTAVPYFKEIVQLVAALTKLNGGDPDTAMLMTRIAHTRYAFREFLISDESKWLKYVLARETDENTYTALLADACVYPMACTKLASRSKTSFLCSQSECARWIHASALDALARPFSWTGVDEPCNLDTEAVFSSYSAAMTLLAIASSMPESPPRALLDAAELLCRNIKSIPRPEALVSAEDVFPHTALWIRANIDILEFFDLLQIITDAFTTESGDGNGDRVHVAKETIFHVVTHGVALLQNLCSRIVGAIEVLHPAILKYTATIDPGVAKAYVSTYKMISWTMSGVELVLVAMAMYASPIVDPHTDAMTRDPLLAACSVSHMCVASRRRLALGAGSDDSAALGCASAAINAHKRAVAIYYSECAQGNAWNGFIHRTRVRVLAEQIGPWAKQIVDCIVQSATYTTQHRPRTDIRVDSGSEMLDAVIAQVHAWPLEYKETPLVPRVATHNFSVTADDGGGLNTGWPKFRPSITPVTLETIFADPEYIPATASVAAYCAPLKPGPVHITPDSAAISRNPTYHKLVDAIIAHTAKDNTTDNETRRMLVNLCEEQMRLLGGVEESIVGMIMNNK